ncbi:SDR family oxidoreductase [Thalassobaculum sp.]|uniref:SDR family oxidoreductase n=1 Tax=Thalassobaculum sp. TaxID=2022740 RepID=UPI0032EF2293
MDDPEIARYPAGTTVLVIGASGVIGSALVRHLAGRDNVGVIAAARRPEPTSAPNVTTVPVDLNDPSAASADQTLTGVTHLVYCAYVDAPGWQAQNEPNARLFEAALGFAERHCPSLRHVTLLQGMKAYGSHLGPFKTPARESDPRIPQRHFYYDQEDALTARAASRGWSWTALRPHVVIGPARRSPLNLAAVLAVHAAFCRARGQPLYFPGSPAAFDSVYQATDAGLLARAIEWAGSEPRAAGEIFNITNGDFFRWRHLWPAIGSVLDLESADPRPTRLAETMADAGAEWDGLVARHGLEPNRLDTLVSWPFADYVFHTGHDVMADTLKCRRAGFLAFADSEAVIVDRLAELRRLKIVP